MTLLPPATAFLTAVASVPAPVSVPPQTGGTSVETILIGVGFLLLGALVSIVGALGRRQLDQILAAQALITAQQLQCQTTLADRFASKIETKEEFRDIRGDIRTIHGRIDELDRVVARGGL